MNKTRSILLAEWIEELDEVLVHSNSFCIALFSTNGQLIFSNQAFDSIIKDYPSRSLINPTFDELLLLESSSNLIFEGFLTLGDHSSVNQSIEAKVYKKKDHILITGGANTKELFEHNTVMHKLNTEVSNLHYDLIKKNQNLEEAMAQLDSANMALSEVNAQKDKLMQIIAHDLRNSFHGVLGFSNILIEDIENNETENYENFVRIINTSSKETLALLEHLLSWSRTQNGTIIYDPERLVLDMIIKDSIKSSDSSAKLKKVDLIQREIDKVEIYADRRMLKTIIRNLISNAIKFSHKGGAIQVSTVLKEKMVEISISDDGIGMNEETLSKLFDISSNRPTLGTANEKGTGLGLNICKEFVEKHGGTIRVESKLGEGSKFMFDIPLHAPLN